MRRVQKEKGVMRMTNRVQVVGIAGNLSRPFSTSTPIRTRLGVYRNSTNTLVNALPVQARANSGTDGLK